MKPKLFTVVRVDQHCYCVELDSRMRQRLIVGPFTHEVDAWKVVKTWRRKHANFHKREAAKMASISDSRAEARQNRLKAWASEPETLRAMWAEGAFGKPHFYKRVGRSERSLSLSPRGLEDPAVDPVAVWCGPVVERTTPVLVNMGGEFWLTVVTASMLFLGSIIRLPLDALTKVDLGEKQVLFEADPDCVHEIVDAPGGGVKCSRCSGWFCY